MDYQHQFLEGQAHLPVGKVVCIGRNYAEHAKELNNPVPDEPLLFIKPSTAITSLSQPIVLPQGRGGLHYETELAILMGERLTNASETDAIKAVAGVGLALDLTLRDLQSSLKAKGLPWEKAKAFDGSCSLSAFVAPAGLDLTQLQLTLRINDQIRQQGDTAQMLLPVTALLAYISEWFTLLPGDVVLTGTPAGVGQLHAGDRLQVQLGQVINTETLVI